jgi:uncharacterized protein YjbJ (UPF0337 family)
MGNLKIVGNWEDLKSKLKQRHAHLTDDDLVFEKGKENELLERLEKITGKPKEEWHDTIQDLQDFKIE